MRRASGVVCLSGALALFLADGASWVSSAPVAVEPAAEPMPCVVLPVTQDPALRQAEQARWP